MHAGQESHDEARRALTDLVRQYWYPLYAFARRRGSTVEDAQDLTQSFLADLMASPEFFHAADPQRGKFRAFLITAFKHFVGRAKERQEAMRRGGQHTILSLNLDFDDGESRYQYEPADHQTPERLFDRRWAITLLVTVLQRLENEYDAKGKADFFQSCRGWLTLAPDANAEPQQQLADQLGMTHGGLRVAVHRLKKRFREILREEVRQTVEHESDIDAEIQSLRDSLST